MQLLRLLLWRKPKERIDYATIACRMIGVPLLMYRDGHSYSLEVTLKSGQKRVLRDQEDFTDEVTLSLFACKGSLAAQCRRRLFKVLDQLYLQHRFGRSGKLVLDPVPPPFLAHARPKVKFDRPQKPRPAIR